MTKSNEELEVASKIVDLLQSHGLTWIPKHQRWVLRYDGDSLTIMDTQALVDFLKVAIKQLEIG